MKPSLYFILLALCCLSLPEMITSQPLAPLLSIFLMTFIAALLAGVPINNLFLRCSACSWASIPLWKVRFKCKENLWFEFSLLNPNLCSINPLNSLTFILLVVSLSSLLINWLNFETKTLTSVFPLEKLTSIPEKPKSAKAFWRSSLTSARKTPSLMNFLLVE